MNNIKQFDPLCEIACIDPFLSIDDIFNRLMMHPGFCDGSEPQSKMEKESKQGELVVPSEGNYGMAMPWDLRWI